MALRSTATVLRLMAWLTLLTLSALVIAVPPVQVERPPYSTGLALLAAAPIPAAPSCASGVYRFPVSAGGVVVVAGAFSMSWPWTLS